MGNVVLTAAFILISIMLLVEGGILAVGNATLGVPIAVVGAAAIGMGLWVYTRKPSTKITFGRSKKKEGCNPSEFGINPLLSMAVLDSADSVLLGESHERSRHGSFPRYRAFCSSAFMMSRNVLGFSPQSDVMELPQEALR